MDIGLQIKKFREQQKISQEELALKIFVSRQTISNWETNKSCPDVKSLITLSDIFNVSLDNFIKDDIKEMREVVEKATIKKFNVISVVFLIELIVVAVSAYPLFSIKGNIGIVIWLCLFAITLYTASKIEKFKKSYDIQTYKEILAFIDGKQLTHDEAQQEIGKRNYQKIIFAFIAGVIALMISGQPHKKYPSWNKNSLMDIFKWFLQFSEKSIPAHTLNDRYTAYSFFYKSFSSFYQIVYPISLGYNKSF